MGHIFADKQPPHGSSFLVLCAACGQWYNNENDYCPGIYNPAMISIEQVRKDVEELIALVGHCDNPDCTGKWCTTAREFIRKYK